MEIKEHYVPKCYLKRWCDKKERLYVFNKENNKCWKRNVIGVGCEGKYYDIPVEKLSKKALDLLHEHNFFPENDEYFIETFLSEQLEDEYSKLLNKIIDIEISPWREKTCYFINEQDKFLMSICLAYQAIRSPQTRKSIKNTSSGIEQMIRGMNVDEGAKERAIKTYKLGETDEKVIQGNLLFDLDEVFDLTVRFYELSWVLGVNKTNMLLYTSDNPIGMYSNLRKAMGNIHSIVNPEVEVFFPLSPRYILLMRNPYYYKDFLSRDRKYMELDKAYMKKYNALCLNNCTQYIYSKEDDFEFVENILKSEGK